MYSIPSPSPINKIAACHGVSRGRPAKRRQTKVQCSQTSGNGFLSLISLSVIVAEYVEHLELMLADFVHKGFKIRAFVTVPSYA